MSEAHQVEGDADSSTRTRTLKFPTFPKPAPRTDTAEPPDETLEAKERDEIVGPLWAASEARVATALKATLIVSSAMLPLSDDWRHVTLESLVQNEPAHAVAARRAAGDDGTLANA